MGIGIKRAQIAPTLTGEDLAEMLALADFCISCGGSLHFHKPGPAVQRLLDLKLVERVRYKPEDRTKNLHRLTKLGWLTLLTRAETEMRHLLPAEPGRTDHMICAKFPDLGGRRENKPEAARSPRQTGGCNAGNRLRSADRHEYTGGFGGSRTADGKARPWLDGIPPHVNPVAHHPCRARCARRAVTPAFLPPFKQRRFFRAAPHKPLHLHAARVDPPGKLAGRAVHAAGVQVPQHGRAREGALPHIVDERNQRRALVFREFYRHQAINRHGRRVQVVHKQLARFGLSNRPVALLHRPAVAPSRRAIADGPHLGWA